MASLINWLRGRRESPEDARTAEALEALVQLSNPRLRYARHYRGRLMPPVRHAMDYSRALIASVAPARSAESAAWQADRAMRAFFATPQDCARAFSRSSTLRTWFAENRGAQEASAVLSMELVERRVLGVALADGVLMRDVPQTTVSFGDYRVRFCAATEAVLREDLERRIVEHLALAGLAAAADDKARREALEQEQALLRTRLRLLETRGAGMSELGTRVDPEEGQRARVQADLAVNEANLTGLAVGSEGIERQLDLLCAALANADGHFPLTNRRIAIDSMNIVVPDGTPNATALDLQIIQVPVVDGPPELRTFALVRFPRVDMLSRADLLSQAERML